MGKFGYVAYMLYLVITVIVLMFGNYTNCSDIAYVFICLLQSKYLLGLRSKQYYYDLH